MSEPKRKQCDKGQHITKIHSAFTKYDYVNKRKFIVLEVHCMKCDDYSENTVKEVSEMTFDELDAELDAIADLGVFVDYIPF